MTWAFPPYRRLGDHGTKALNAYPVWGSASSGARTQPCLPYHGTHGLNEASGAFPDSVASVTATMLIKPVLLSYR
jgi:hypothetical protein